MENVPIPDNAASLEQAADPKTALLDLEAQVDNWIEQARENPPANVTYEHHRLDDGMRLEVAKYGKTLTVHRSIPENMLDPTHFFITYYLADGSGVANSQLTWNSFDRQLRIVNNVDLQGPTAIRAARMAAQLHSLFGGEEVGSLLGTGMNVEFWTSRPDLVESVRSSVFVAPEGTADKTSETTEVKAGEPVTRRGLFGWLGKLGTKGGEEK